MLALLLANGQAANLHFHGDRGSAHPQHQHGIAAHHHSALVHLPSNVPEIEAADPADDVIRMVLCSVVTTHHAPVVVSPVLTADVDLPATLDRLMPRETRAHGPPYRTTRLLRAPPAQIPA